MTDVSALNVSVTETGAAKVEASLASLSKGALVVQESMPLH